jgi:hypothetical protein
MSEIALAHLVRSSNPIGMFESFLVAYRGLDAGVEHDLIIIFKGFEEGDRGLKECYDRLSGLSYRPFFFPDVQFDIGAYRATARTFPHAFFCFLNSHAEPLAAGWLEKFYRHARRNGVGVVGATGSYESPRSYWWIYAGLPQGRGYRFLCRHLGPFFPGLTAGATDPGAWWLPHLRDFPKYPNPHIRTNGFMIGREMMLRLRFPKLRDKVDCYRFEFGRRSMTRQIRARGLKPLVVGRDGAAYEVDQWHESWTFRSGDQSNLLIADNQTKYNAELGWERIQGLARLAWGDRPAYVGAGLDESRVS